MGEIHGYPKTSASGFLQDQQTGRLARPPGRVIEFKASSHGSNTRRSTQRRLGGGGAVLRGGRRGGAGHGDGMFLASTYSCERRQPNHFTQEQTEAQGRCGGCLGSQPKRIRAQSCFHLRKDVHRGLQCILPTLSQCLPLCVIMDTL